MHNEFLKTHIIKPLFVWFAVFYFWNAFDFDYTISSFIYEIHDQSFVRNFFMDFILHKGISKLVSLIYICLLLLIIYQNYFYKPYLKMPKILMPYKQGIIYLFVSGITTIATISILKHYSSHYCPKNFDLFGGVTAYVQLFDLPVFAEGRGGRCFPAGFASSGYSWLSLYFFAMFYFPHNKYKILKRVLIMSWLFDFTQQLRGMHFASHGMVTLMLCWVSATIWYLILLKDKDNY